MSKPEVFPSTTAVKSGFPGKFPSKLSIIIRCFNSDKLGTYGGSIVKKFYLLLNLIVFRGLFRFNPLIW